MGDSATVVLVVEDDADIRDPIVEFLASRGYAAYGAANGLEALDLLSGMERLPCVILIDCNMPVMNGDEFCAELRRQQRFARIPLLVISAYPAALAHIDAERLPKPFTMAQVLEVVERYCHLAGQSAA